MAVRISSVLIVALSVAGACADPNIQSCCECFLENECFDETWASRQLYPQYLDEDGRLLHRCYELLDEAGNVALTSAIDYGACQNPGCSDECAEFSY